MSDPVSGTYKPGTRYPAPAPPPHPEADDEEEEADDTADRESEAFIDAKTRQLKNYFSDDEKDRVKKYKLDLTKGPCVSTD